MRRSASSSRTLVATSLRLGLRVLRIHRFRSVQPGYGRPRLCLVDQGRGCAALSHRRTSFLSNGTLQTVEQQKPREFTPQEPLAE